MRGKWERKENERKENREERKLEIKYNPLSCLVGGGKTWRKENGSISQ